MKEENVWLESKLRSIESDNVQKEYTIDLDQDKLKEICDRYEEKCAGLRKDIGELNGTIENLNTILAHEREAVE